MGCDQKAPYKSMQDTRWLWRRWARVVPLRRSKLGRCIALCWEAPSVPAWSCRRRRLGQALGESAALWKSMGKICKLCYAFGKIHPVGFGQGWWASQVIEEGAFSSRPLRSAASVAERDKDASSKFAELGGKCQWRAPAPDRCLPGDTHRNHQLRFCILPCQLVHLCSMPLNEMKGSDVESGKSRKLGWLFLLWFAKVHGTLCAVPT